MAAPRSLDQRLADTRAHLVIDVDLWIASAHDDQPWREENELEGRHLMRDGRWLDEGGSDGS